MAADSDIIGALTTLAGLSARERVRADVIHALLVTERQDVERLLAGEILGDFGSFLIETGDTATSSSDVTAGWSGGVDR
jgi:hypothetical protein